jgi:hypothetical protein
MFGFFKNFNWGEMATGAVLGEIAETFLENQGILKVERDPSSGKVLKRNFLNVGPNDEAIFLMGWYDAFVQAKIIKEGQGQRNGLTQEIFMHVDRAFDRLGPINSLKMKSIIGIQMRETHSDTMIEKTGGGKGKGPMKERIEKKSTYENVDGKKILILCATIVKNGGGGEAGEDVLIQFLKGEIFVPVSEIVKSIALNVNDSVGKVFDGMGIDAEQREIKTIKLRNSINVSKMKALILRAKLKGISVEELLQQTA